MNINPAQTPEENLVNLISTSNGGKSLPVADAIFGGVTDFDNGQGGNSQVEVTAHAESTLYVGAQTFNYNRLDLATEAGYTGVAAELANVAEDAATPDLVAAIVTQMGLIASEVEAGTVVLPVDATEGSMELNAVAGSLVYRGTVSVALFPVDSREEMSSAFATQDLEAMEGPGAPQ